MVKLLKTIKIKEIKFSKIRSKISLLCCCKFTFILHFDTLILVLVKMCQISINRFIDLFIDSIELILHEREWDWEWDREWYSGVGPLFSWTSLFLKMLMAASLLMLGIGAGLNTLGFEGGIGGGEGLWSGIVLAATLLHLLICVRASPIPTHAIREFRKLTPMTTICRYCINCSLSMYLQRLNMDSMFRPMLTQLQLMGMVNISIMNFLNGSMSSRVQGRPSTVLMSTCLMPTCHTYIPASS